MLEDNLFTLNQIEHIVSERTYSVTKHIDDIIWQGILHCFLLPLVPQDKTLLDYLFSSSDL